MPPVVNGPFGGGNGIAEKTQKEVKKKQENSKMTFFGWFSKTAELFFFDPALSNMIIIINQ